MLEYDGPRDPEAMWEEEKFRFVTVVTVQKSSIIACRPIFRGWSATIVAEVDTDLIDIDMYDTVLSQAGQMVGLCDWRPRYGRFEVK